MTNATDLKSEDAGLNPAGASILMAKRKKKKQRARFDLGIKKWMKANERLGLNHLNKNYAEKNKEKGIKIQTK